MKLNKFDHIENYFIFPPAAAGDEEVEEVAAGDESFPPAAAGDEEEEEVAADDGEEEEVHRMGRTGRPMKDWASLGPQQKRAKTENLYQELKRTAEARQVSPVKLVGSLLRR